MAPIRTIHLENRANREGRPVKVSPEAKRQDKPAESLEDAYRAAVRSALI